MGRFLDFVFNRFFLGMIATAFFLAINLGRRDYPWSSAG